MIQKTLRILVWTAAALVVLLAVGLSAARLLLPAMSDYRAEIEALASRTLGQPVTIGSLDAAWQGLSPVLELKEVTVRTPYLADGRLAVQEVHLALDVVASLYTQRWQTAGVRVIGVELDIDTDLRSAEHQFDLEAVSGWLATQQSISLEQFQIQWRDAGLFEAPLRLNQLSAQLRNSGRRHQLLIKADLPPAMGTTLSFAADLSGPGTAIADWKGRLYLKAEQLDLAAFQPAFRDATVAAGGVVDIELWTGLESDRLAWGNGTLTWLQPEVRNTSDDAQAVSADSLTAGLQWRRLEQGWRLAIQNFEIDRDESRVWPSSEVRLQVDDSESPHIRGEASLLVLEEVAAVLPLIPWIDDDALAMLDRLQPEGALHDAAFELKLQRGELPRFAMRSEVEELSLAANGGLPGVKGLSGTVEGNLQAGSLVLDSSNASLVAPGVFPESLPVDQLKGTLHWQRFGSMFRLETDQLELTSGALQTESRWRLDWSYDQPAPWLDFQLSAESLPLVDVPGYLPRGAMSPGAVAWLDRAFRAGNAHDIRVMLQGRLDQLPFAEGQGTLEARFSFDDVMLDYHPDWGQLGELSGEALFTARRMEITGDSGRILESPVKATVAEINDFKQPVLEINGTVGGTLAAMLEYVQTTPLQKNFGPLIEKTEADGDAHLQLGLRIPLLKRLGAVSLRGDVSLDDSTLLIKPDDLGLENIRGQLVFTEDGIQVKQADARLLGRPVKVVVGKQGLEGRSQTVVDIRGRFGLQDVLKQEQAQWRNSIVGRSDWHAQLGIQNQSLKNVPRVRLRLMSNLEGVAIKLPEPFGKTPDEVRELAIDWTPEAAGQQPLTIDYGEKVRALALLDSRGDTLRQAAVRFGGDAARLSGTDGVSLSGDLSGFDLGEWLRTLDGLGQGAGKDGPRLSIDLNAGQFRYAGYRVADVHVTSRAADPWHFQVEGDNSKGWLRWVPAERVLPQRLLLNFERLYLQDDKADDSVPETAEETLSPRALPELELSIADLKLDDRELGTVKLNSRRILNGTRFERFTIQGPAIVLDGSGAWLAQNGDQISRFLLTVTDGDLGKLTTLLGTGSEVKGGKLSGKMTLDWPGAPMAFDLSTVEADIRLKAKDGRLTGVDDGPGKLLSLFSLNSLQRRLSLDFRDVVKEGFSFDTMEGDFVIMDGDAFTNDFSIEGTSVRINIAGRTGLVARDYDQLVTVTPQVTSTLPIAGAIAGGPAVGAAVFLADKLVGDQFNKLTRVRYQVTGSWDHPVYKRLKKKAGDEKQPPAPEDVDVEEP